MHDSSVQVSFTFYFCLIACVVGIQLNGSKRRIDPVVLHSEGNYAIPQTILHQDLALNMLVYHNFHLIALTS